jgi:hypothetical protein
MERLIRKDWRKLHNNNLHNSYASPDIVSVIKLETRWVGHVTRMRKPRNKCKIFVGNPTGDLGVDEMN